MRAAICSTYSLQDDTTATRKSNIIHIYTKRADTSVTTHAKKKMTRHRENENRERNQESKKRAAKKYDREKK